MRNITNLNLDLALTLVYNGIVSNAEQNIFGYQRKVGFFHQMLKDAPEHVATDEFKVFGGKSEALREAIELTKKNLDRKFDVLYKEGHDACIALNMVNPYSLTTWFAWAYEEGFCDALRELSAEDDLNG